MDKLRKTAKWLAATLALFGAFVFSQWLGSWQVGSRGYAFAAVMTGFFAGSALLPKWPVWQRFACRFGYISLSMPAMLFYFDEPFSWIRCVFMPLGIATLMAAVFAADDLREADELKKKAESGEKAA